MGFAELFLIAVGLSMDAFAVSVCKGLCMKRLDMRQALVIALFFGGFQGLMPLLGWALGTQFERYITPVGLIGAPPFVLALVGVAVGHRFGARYEKAAAIAGGVVLVLIGTKILLEHLGILAL